MNKNPKYVLEYLEEDYPHDFKCASEYLKPDPKKFPTYKEGDVIDEEQSVRWNREEVARRIQAYKDEIKRLEDVRLENIHKVNNDVIEAIAFELDNRYIVLDEDIAHKKATALFNYANLIRHNKKEDAYYLAILVKQLIDFVEIWEGAEDYNEC